MEKQIILEKARDFAKRSLEKNNKRVSKDDYYMFLISRFLLLKEMIIKKDSENNEIYFDYEKNKDYLPVIKYIVDFIKVSGTIQQNSVKVVIEPEEYNDSTLQFYIWTFNKIRDSLSHGRYDFDFNNEQIIVDNDHSDSRDPFVLKCILPMELLELFSYIVENPKDCYTDKEIGYFNEFRRKMRGDFGYENILNKGNNIINYFNNYSNINNFQYKDLNIINNIDIKSNINNYVDKKSNISNEKYYNSISGLTEYNLDNYSKKQEEILSLLLKILGSSEKLTDEQKSIVYRYLNKLNLLSFKENEFKYEVVNNNKVDIKYVEKLATVISEISSILGIKKESNNMVAISAIYNYMQLTFSLNEFDFMSKEEKDSLGYLKISKLHPKYVKFNKGNVEENYDSQYALKIKSIQIFTENFIVKMRERLEQYRNNPSSSFRNSLNTMFKKYYDEIISSFADKNSFILTSIRNSVEHANVHDVDGNILLNDQNNQNDNDSINFYCYGKIEDFYEIINNLEEGIDKDMFTFNDFLDELKMIIDISAFNELLSLIDDLKKVNTEALVNVISQSSVK